MRLALDGQGHLFVGEYGAEAVGEYSTSGAAVNPVLISGLRDYPTGLALDGNGHLFVATELHGVVGEYTTSGGP
jgi:hypothetical protein